jgi:hypothetical protein
MRTFRQDLAKGMSSEEFCLPILQKLSSSPLRRLGKYARFDYESDDCLIELKTRLNVSSKSYSTTMINKHKVDAAKGLSKKVYYAFRYTDGIYYIEYSPKLFDSFQSLPLTIQDRADYIEVEEDKMFIPIENLTLLYGTTPSRNTLI